MSKFVVGGMVVYDGIIRGVQARHVGIIERILFGGDLMAVDFGYTDVPLVRVRASSLEVQ